jgi:hypothetical protein
MSTTIAITGSTGLVGSALAAALTADGYRVQSIRRDQGGKGDSPVFADVKVGTVPAEPLYAVVHLAGEPIASGRWTAAKKSRIRTSRVEGTHALCQSLARRASPPRVLLCASAVGYYGNRGDELLDEESPSGDGFLAEVVRDWEGAAQPALQRGIRVVFLRLGMVLTPTGGAMAKMLPAFRWGLGGRIGSGRQYWSWIALNDAIGAIRHALVTDSLAGPVNVVAPQPCTNAEFAAALGRVLRRPVLANMPGWAARLAFGPMADELLLASARVLPKRLVETGYAFRHANLPGALESLLQER